MLMTEIREISIPEIYIPNPYVPQIYKPDITHVTQYLEINPPGCTYQHRDIKNTGNHNLLLDDPNGVYTICDFTFPNFYPPDYNPNRMTMIEESLPQGGDPDIPKTETPRIPDKEEEEIVIPECPGPKDQRVGDYRNAKKLEIVSSHRLDGTDCITLSAPVNFKDQYIPSANQFIGVFSLALVGASAPLVLQLVKPIVKQVITKLTKKKK